MSLENYKVISPRVRIKVMGGPRGVTGTDLERHLVRFQYVDRRGRRPMIHMDFDNADGLVFNFSVLMVGLKLEVSFGYENFMSRPFIVPVKKVKATSMGEPGRSIKSPHPDAYGLVTMSAPVYNTKMHFRPDDDVWLPTSPMPLSRAVKQIARKYGYTEKQIFVEEGHPTKGHKESTFDESQILENETVDQFLRRKARELGYFYQASRKAFQWHSEEWKVKPAETIQYFKGPDLLEFDIEGDYNMALTAVKAKSLDPWTGETLTFTINKDGSVQGMAASKPLRTGSVTKDPYEIQPKDIVSSISKKAADKAVRRLLAHVRNRWKLNMTLVGNPQVLVGLGLNLGNFGPVIDGMWWVREVEHTVDGNGYTTRIAARQRHLKGGGGGPIWPTYTYNKDGSVQGMGAALAGYPPKKSKRKRRRKLKPLKPFKKLH